jgi:photosystem II stability/assembly factor-like uncharacterized protein
MAFCAAEQNGPPYDTLHIGTGFNVYTARWNGTTWDSVCNVGRHVNPACYPTVSPGGETLLYTKGSDLFMSLRIGGDWSNPIRLPYPVNDTSAQVKDGPCAIDWDMRRLYFRSTRLGGYGSGDIWCVRILPGGYDSLTNLGPNVNSTGMETHPAISADGQRLYFSDFGGGRPGWEYGDCDIYVSHWTGTEWGPAELLPAPVNTDLPACSAFEMPDGRLYLGSEVSEGTAGEEDVWVAERGEVRRQKSEGMSRDENLDSWENTGELAGATYVYRLVEQGGAVYAATAPDGNVFRTTNGGTSWQSTGDIGGESHIYSLIVLQDSSLLCGTYPNGKVYRSTDAGVSWTELAQFPYAHAVRCLLQKADGTLFAGTSPDSEGIGRIWRSTDAGTTWQRTGDIPLVAGGVFCLSEVPGGPVLAGARVNGDRFYVSLNNGNTWTVQNLPYADTLVSIGHLYFFRRTSDNRLWLGGWLHGPQGVLFSSTNNGQQWDTVGVIPNGTMIVARVFDMCEAGDGSYFIGFHPGPDSVVFRSTDHGVTWRNCGGLAGANEALCLLRAADGTIYAGTTPNGDVFKYVPAGIAQEPGLAMQTDVIQSPVTRSGLARLMGRQVVVHDATGRRVSDANHLQSGVYLVTLRSLEPAFSRKVVLMRE